MPNTKSNPPKTPGVWARWKGEGPPPTLGDSNITLGGPNTLELLRNAKHDPDLRWIVKLATEQNLPLHITASPLNSDSTYGAFSPPQNLLSQQTSPAGSWSVVLNPTAAGEGGGLNTRTLTHEMIHYIQRSMLGRNMPRADAERMAYYLSSPVRRDGNLAFDATNMKDLYDGTMDQDQESRQRLREFIVQMLKGKIL